MRDHSFSEGRATVEDLRTFADANALIRDLVKDYSHDDIVAMLIAALEGWNEAEAAAPTKAELRIAYNTGRSHGEAAAPAGLDVERDLAHVARKRELDEAEKVIRGLCTTIEAQWSTKDRRPPATYYAGLRWLDARLRQGTDAQDTPIA